MQIRSANNNDLDAIKSLLGLSGLPSEDCHEHLANFVVTEHEGEIVGAGGLEILGDIALLRSIAVKKEYQKRNIAKNIYLSLKNKAVSLDIKQLFLLTVTAESYFERLGFATINRRLAPKEVKCTKQFSGLCSSSAIVMKLDL